MFIDGLDIVDKDVHDAIASEARRTDEGLELIPSENFPSKAVLEALGSVMNNKYAEGYPFFRKKDGTVLWNRTGRYYGGNRYIDIVEKIAIERAKKLFGADHVNVQPYSGSPANIEVYFALLEFGDKIMGMDLAQGGHLTHGHGVNFSGKAYNVVHYGVDKETNLLDYDEIRKLAEREKPKLIISGATAYPRKIDFKEFDDIAKDVGAYSMADIAHIAGLVVGGVHMSPVPYMDVVTTTTHKTLRGPRGAMIMCKEGLAAKIDKAVFPGMQGGPHEHAIAAKAVAFKEALEPGFKDYARQIVKNAQALADALMENGFKLVTDGTDNHLILVDLRNKGITGKDAEAALDASGITVNKNTIPYDTGTPWNPSGIRLGTPAVTTRGMNESEMKEIASFISRAIDAAVAKDEAALEKIRLGVKELASNFPIYG
ncbi:MAG: serine hydroxymethyltransferase [Candidatus Micrarchaeota archaeon]|nr:serine hydroxymethyltransferase [Candidatus Micrarchaeota archaeon]